MRFVTMDVDAITSPKPREDFDPNKVEELANAILECNGLVKPLILKPTSPETYEVVDGFLEYWAAVKASEKNLQKGEMVNAFVILPKDESMIVRQMDALQQSEAGKTIEPIKSVKPSEETSLQLVQKEIANINGKINELSPKLIEMVQQMKQNFEESFHKCFKELDKISSVVIQPKPLTDAELIELAIKRGISLKSKNRIIINELKLLAKAIGVSVPSKITKDKLKEEISKKHAENCVL